MFHLSQSCTSRIYRMQSWNLASKAVRVEGCGSVKGGRRKGSGMGDGALSGGGVLTVPRRSGKLVNREIQMKCWGRAGDGAAVKTPATYISANPPARTVLAHCTHSTATPQKYVAGSAPNDRPRCSVAAVPKGGGFTLGDCHPKSNIPHERGCSSCSPAAQKPQSCRAW